MVKEQTKTLREWEMAEADDNSFARDPMTETQYRIFRAMWSVVQLAEHGEEHPLETLKFLRDEFFSKKPPIETEILN